MIPPFDDPRRRPTIEEFREHYRGARHQTSIFRAIAADWKCPVCRRSLYELLHFTRSPFPAWEVLLAKHHDHKGERNGFLVTEHSRFIKTIVCQACNMVDVAVKNYCRRKHGPGFLDDDFSFSVTELAEIVVGAEPHGKIVIDYDKAIGIWLDRLVGD